MKRIICAGTFDLLHTGHIKYLREAKSLSGNSYLIVIVARDSNSEKIKKKKTIHNESVRLARLMELDFVDEVVLGYEGDKFIERVVSLKPDIIALGYDQWAKEEWLKKELESKGVNVEIVRMPRFDKVFL